MVADARADSEEKTRQLRLAIVSGGPETYLAQMFPESAPTSSADDLSESEVMESEGASTWQMAEIVSPADAEEIMARLGREGTFTMDDL